MLDNEQRQKLRDLVDLTWNEATESTEVPATSVADRLIGEVFEKPQFSTEAHDAFEKWWMNQYLVSKQVLEGLRIHSGYRNDLMSGKDINKSFHEWMYYNGLTKF